MKYNSANMNTLIKSCLTLCLLWSAIGSHAQVIKKAIPMTRKRQATNSASGLNRFMTLRMHRMPTFRG